MNSVFPTQETIAKYSDCSLRTVVSFTKKYKNIIFDYRNRVDAKTKRRSSNEYFLNNDFFEFIWCMKRLGYLQLWKTTNSRLPVAKKKAKTDIFRCVCEDALYLIDKVDKLLTKNSPKLRMAFLPKLRTIRDLPLIRELFEDKNVLREKRTGCEQPKDQEREFGELEGIPLSWKDKKLIETTFALFAKRQAIEDFKWYSKCYKVINPAAFLWDRAKKYTKHKLKF